MTLPTTVQVRQRGTLTLPADIRERYHIQPGDSTTSWIWRVSWC